MTLMGNWPTYLNPGNGIYLNYPKFKLAQEASNLGFIVQHLAGRLVGKEPKN